MVDKHVRRLVILPVLRLYKGYAGLFVCASSECVGLTAAPPSLPLCVVSRIGWRTAGKGGRGILFVDEMT